jgi:GH25 family lysozyme M1 (1,4-beta-N-acetylmuramidase)
MPPTRHSRFGVPAIGAGLIAVVVTTTLTLAGTAAPAGATTATVIDGPDVSSYQHSTAPNWSKVAAAGKDFVFVKATEGTSYTNPYFKSDYSGVRLAGMVRGSYHFARPAAPVVSSARAQAKAFAAALGTSPETTRTLPPVLDLETTGGLSQPRLIVWAQTFLLQLQRSTGRRPLLYTYPSFWSYTLGDAPALRRFPLWMANYSTSTPPAGATLWQYTSTASVPGISGNVDMSRFPGTATEWSTISDGTGGDPWPVAAPGVPQQVAASASGTTATVHWLPGDAGSSDITGYRVTASSSTGDVVARVGATSFSASLTGLTPGTQYAVTVAATNAVGTGAASAPLPVTTSLVPTAITATPPAAVAFGQPSTTRIRLTRTDNLAGLAEQNVTVQRRPMGTTTWFNWTTVTTASDGTASVTLSQPRHDVELRFSFAEPGFKPTQSISAALVQSAVSAVLSTGRAHPAKPVALTGVVAPQATGVVVRRQVLTADGWHTVQQTTTFADGSYQFDFVTPDTATTLQMRSRVAAYGGREAGVSPTVSLIVR